MLGLAHIFEHMRFRTRRRLRGRFFLTALNGAVANSHFEPTMRRLACSRHCCVGNRF
ncbi:hypothetical protein C3B44_00210 [Corynebacterium yudongzhengii]|uniref:Uncharacterized protein n=1 Tax=Corynebacterium yudongzhengii TaxID=2080740 RepID=A0A2U1T5D8_9CORY|nr:hypothetical protein C3B44_00210 [Corynebacterium yudongzhengii]PWC01108.1 hypothetical protein DF222_09035 [Corynebacterium yudongzhengii]